MKVNLFKIVICSLYIIGINLAAQEPMKFVYFDSFPPYSWEDEKQMKGILIDIVNTVVRDRLHVPVQHEGYPGRSSRLRFSVGEIAAALSPICDARGSTAAVRLYKIR